MTICFLRTVILYLLLICAIRLMGKKQVGELEPSELVLAMLVSDLSAVPMQDFGIPLLYGVLPILVLVCMTMLFSLLCMKSLRLRSLLCGEPTVIVRNGLPDQGALARNRFTVDELMEELRTQGIPSLDSVKYAVLENSGQVSFLLYDRESPVTPARLGLEVQEGGLPLILVSDGQVIERNLRLLGHDRRWLLEQLNANGIGSIAAAFLLTADENGSVCAIAKEGRT